MLALSLTEVISLHLRMKVVTFRQNELVYILVRGSDGACQLLLNGLRCSWPSDWRELLGSGSLSFVLLGWLNRFGNFHKLWLGNHRLERLAVVAECRSEDVFDVHTFGKLQVSVEVVFVYIEKSVHVDYSWVFKAQFLFDILRLSKPFFLSRPEKESFNIRLQQ